MTATVSGLFPVMNQPYDILSVEPEFVDGGVAVVDGLGNIDDVGDFLHIGVDNPFGTGQVAAGQSDQEWSGAGPTLRTETGSVTCVVICRDADGDQRACRTRCEGILATVQRLLRTNIRLDPEGFTAPYGLVKTSFGGLEYDQDNAEDGALALAVFRVGFTFNLNSEG
ncbi:MAG: hypothetical protein IPJ61_20500 [Tessaracoccus sp.]|uniref:hypothetical protein n=1 Tax=Tessaracoccus sp. TaxID=1971211 RepID=UPI001EC13D09|nr:hypothetical protein [Tessaracoccus sp.]MBK7823369.1 hypothetical protein [Tessaracoccus sp.]